MPKKMHTLPYTPEAARLIAAADARRASSSQLSTSHPQHPEAEDWITTTEAARLTGYSDRNIYRLCDEGFLVAGQDWKQRPASPGRRSAGRIFIKRSALKKLES